MKINVKISASLKTTSYFGSATNSHGCTNVAYMTNKKPAAKKTTKKPVAKKRAPKKVATAAAPKAPKPQPVAQVIYAGDVKNPTTKKKFFSWFRR